MDKETNNLACEHGIQGATGMPGNLGPIGTYHDYTYMALLRRIDQEGRTKHDRTGVGTRAVFGHDMRFSLLGGVIPLLTTKKMFLPAIIHEIIWYLSGSSNVKYLQENGVRIWNEWADENGDLGPVYGFQWRHWPAYQVAHDAPNNQWVTAFKTEVDQIQNVLNDLKNNPDSRRIIVSAWNVADVPAMNLPPCHAFFQFYTEVMTIEERVEWYENETGMEVLECTHEGLDAYKVPRRYLSCKLTQRSADAFLGVPFNIAQYSILTHLFAKLAGMVAKDFIWSGGDCHIYTNHVDQVREQLTRTPFKSPRIKIASTVDNIDDLKYNDFEIYDYEFHPAIKAQVAV